jgi:hypothetical protein
MPRMTDIPLIKNKDPKTINFDDLKMNLWKMINLMIKDMLLQYSFFFFCCTGA